MKALFLDKNGDFVITKDGFKMVDGLDQLVQEVSMSYGTAQGEYFLDEDAGMDYTSWQTKPIDETELRSDMIECVQGTSVLVSTDSIEFEQNFETRKLTATVKLSTDDGAEFIMEDVFL